MNAAQHTLIFGIRAYRWVLSPAKTFLFGAHSQCRFTPSCSAYAVEAIATHGALVGTWLALKRLARCHPWGGCGEDLVPKKVTKANCNCNKDSLTQDASALAGETPITTLRRTPAVRLGETAAATLGH